MKRITTIALACLCINAAHAQKIKELYDVKDIASPFFNNPDNQNTTMAVGDKFKATCVGGKKDGKSYTFTESKYESVNEYHAVRLATLTDNCLEGGGCVNVCQLNVSVKKLSKN